LNVKKYFNITILFIIIFLLVSIPISAKVDIGGELAASLLNIIDNEGNISAYPQASLDLELYIPPFDNNQIKSAVYLYTNPSTGQLDFMFKKLYLKHKFDKLHLSLESIRKKIENFLMEEYKKQGSNIIKVSLSRKEMAEHMGIQRPSLSRELIKMRDVGIIDFNREVIIIKDMAALSKL